jgi:hypothetical protein
LRAPTRYTSTMRPARRHSGAHHGRQGQRKRHPGKSKNSTVSQYKRRYSTVSEGASRVSTKAQCRASPRQALPGLGCWRCLEVYAVTFTRRRSYIVTGGGLTSRASTMEGRGSSAIGTMHVTVHAVELDSHMMGEAFCVVRPPRPHPWASLADCHRPKVASRRKHRAEIACGDRVLTRTTRPRPRRSRRVKPWPTAWVRRYDRAPLPAINHITVRTPLAMRPARPLPRWFKFRWMRLTQRHRQRVASLTGLVRFADGQVAQAADLREAHFRRRRHL